MGELERELEAVQAALARADEELSELSQANKRLEREGAVT
jgi:hypothetical protein